ncbi:MAG: UDP-N-acetylmuramoyl-L-alanine--D-glutamate ligase [Clostridiales bacterium]|nr:UDP-N-acetylmuramoyl-L-alanine--D-glutamate ligase [Clostridiales bacterium]
MSDIIVYGKGKTGQNLVKMLEKLGKSAVMYDDASGFDGNAEFTSDTTVLLSPGVPPHAKGVHQAKLKGARLVGELEFCFPYCKGRCISVTGTNGKTTTCEMIYHILQTSGVKSRLLGNGGVPFCSQVLDIEKNETVVLESSSFQLADCASFAPYVSVFTNLQPDHLNYHASFADYANAKVNNFVHQKQGYALFNLDDKAVVELSGKCSCNKLFYSIDNAHANCYYDGHSVILQDSVKRTQVETHYFSQLARHNLSNALGAVLACCSVGVSPNVAVKAMESYQFLPHRLQKVATVGGVTFVDDSKATNVAATVSALKCFSDNVAVILGGSDKGEDFDALFDGLQPNVKLITATGETALKIHECGARYGKDVKQFEDIRQATYFCYETIKQVGGIVLMSNACASFDKFSGYKERGEYFQKVVAELSCETAD